VSPLPGPGRVRAAQNVESVVRLVIENRLGIRAVGEMGTLSGPVVPAWSHQLFSVTRDRTSGSVRDNCIIEPGVVCEHCGYCRARGY